MSIGASHNDREQALSSPISNNVRARQKKVPTVAKERPQYEYEPFAWWLTRQQIGQDLRERYAVAQELPPHLLTLVKELDEGHPSLAR
jgi:hypothetical protein